MLFKYSWKLDCKLNYKKLDFRSRYMLKSDILEMSTDIVFSLHFEFDFSCYILLTEQISLYHCFYYLNMCISAICVLQMLFPKVVMSKILKLT